jgi:hypothetical protein
MEMVIVYLSVPLFLLGVLVIALFVLPRYPRREPAHGGSPAEHVPGAHAAPPVEQMLGTLTDPTKMVGWGLTLLLYAAFAVAMLSKLKLNKEKRVYGYTL